MPVAYRVALLIFCACLLFSFPACNLGDGAVVNAGEPRPVTPGTPIVAPDIAMLPGNPLLECSGQAAFEENVESFTLRITGFSGQPVNAPSRELAMEPIELSSNNFDEGLGRLIAQLPPATYKQFSAVVGELTVTRHDGSVEAVHLPQQGDLAISLTFQPREPMPLALSSTPEMKTCLTGLLNFSEDGGSTAISLGNTEIPVHFVGLVAAVGNPR